MKDSKLFNLFKTFNEQEFKNFEKFIDSPYYNKGRDLLPFFKVLKYFYPDFESKDLSSKYIFNKLYPGKSFNPERSENLIRTLSSHLFRVCKEYLVILELEFAKSKKKYLLLNQLRKKNLYKEFDRECSDLPDDVISNSGKGSVGYFVDNYHLCAVKRDCSLNRDFFQESFEFTVKASENLITAALISAYKFEDEKNLAKAYNVKIQNNIIQDLLDNLNSDNLISEMKKNNAGHHEYLQVFHAIYLMNRFNDNTGYYFKLKELLKSYSSVFGQSENYVLWNVMLTYCGVNKLKPEESFQLYKYMLDNDVYKLSAKENFHIVLFRNIVINSSSIGKFKWLEEFINNYSGELHENHRDNMRYYSMAYLCFARSEFEKALEHILSIKYNLFLFKLDLRILQLKTYFELGYYEEGLSLVSSLSTYLSNTKEFAEYIKDSIRNFVKCMKELIRLRTGVQIKDNDIFILKKSAQSILHTNLSEWLTKK
ncbi:MAG TPA: hypothetical protein PKC91_08860, partial [Ignavibacteria bacterium]|nr:hypothetical protein [Ignavibacteria bacterium]